MDFLCTVQYDASDDLSFSQAEGQVKWFEQQLPPNITLYDTDGDDERRPRANANIGDTIRVTLKVTEELNEDDAENGNPEEAAERRAFDSVVELEELTGFHLVSELVEDR